MSRTLLALLVPEAEPLVAEIRARYDPAARRGLGAHITLVYPFLDSGDITPLVMSCLRYIAAGHRAFDFRLKEIKSFPATVWLAPEPVEPFRALASSLERAFPDRPSAGRSFPQFTPHLSVARDIRRDRESTAALLKSRLDENGPIDARAGHIVLLASVGGLWQHRGAVPLGVGH